MERHIFHLTLERKALYRKHAHTHAYVRGRFDQLVFAVTVKFAKSYVFQLHQQWRRDNGIRPSVRP